ncbi:MAG: 50S ribosomal protein L11 methyltransferase [Bacteroidetes bacterium]|nr:50S ribosomal protein L11 methyltransferase [Bacteroidota bacterium]
MPATYFVITLKAQEESFEHIFSSVSDLEGFLGSEEGFDELKLSFSSSEQTEPSLTRWLTALSQELTDLNPAWEVTWQIVSETEQNWNAQWEATIEPVIVEDTFCIFPSWHPAEKTYPVMIHIDPKMSFGTGYHETTRLMLVMMKNADLKGKSVIDCGTGTAVLAIASKKLGAGPCIAFDIDHWSYENSLENLKLNLPDGSVDLRFGGYETISETEKADIILANVNRNVHLQYTAWYAGRLNPGGTLFLSGLLKYDEPEIRKAFISAGFTGFKVFSENEWIGIEVRK